MLMISPKEGDQEAVKSAIGMDVALLPAVGLTRGRLFQFIGGFVASYRAAKTAFRRRAPRAVLAMGGFTSAPPVLAGRSFGAATFLHESNTIPGRANRLLAHFVNQAFVGFPVAAGRLLNSNVLTTGTPVRPQFDGLNRSACRVALGLTANRPVLLIMGGSQGAAGINDLTLRALPELLEKVAGLQILHLTGIAEQPKVEAAYGASKIKAVIRPFLTEMEFALGAASAAVSRAGASSLAELAAIRLPAVLVPYPAAADNHQFYNAKTFVDAGAALMLEQRAATPAQLSDLVVKLLQDKPFAEGMRARLEELHRPHAAELIADKIILMLEARGQWNFSTPGKGAMSTSPLRHSQVLTT